MSGRILFVLQPTHRPIDEAMAKSVLSDDALRLPSDCVVLDQPAVTMDETPGLDWAAAQATIIDVFRASIEPELRKDARVVYLGATPIPLAMQLGYLLADWVRVDAYQRHHETGDWAWPPRSRAAPSVRTAGIVSELRAPTPCDIIVRLTSGPEISVAATAAMVPDALMAVDITLEPRGRDALEQPEDVENLADAFRAALDDLSDRLPRATFHLFAAVPVAMALKLGTRVSSTRHRPVLVYQLVAREDERFRLAFELQGPATSGRRILTAEEVERAAKERAMWAEELRALAARAGASESPASWRRDHPALERSPWDRLPELSAISRVLTDVDLERTDVDGFRFDGAQRVWLLSDELLLAIAHRLDREADRRAAARLFFLHEGLHEEIQGVTEATSASVGRFPRVLEDLDYQADAWALLHELQAGPALGERSNEADASTRMRKLIWIATETFWAFDAGDSALAEIQVRRMNRYLLWYWQSVRMERLSTEREVIDLLAVKPVLELAGLPTFLRGGRPAYRLDLQRANRLELAVVEGVTLQRRPEGQPHPWGELVEGFRARSGDAILRSLHGVADNLAVSRSRATD